MQSLCPTDTTMALPPSEEKAKKDTIITRVRKAGHDGLIDKIIL